MTKSAIEFQNVMKKFPKAAVPSVHETNLTIEKGKFVTILGASGCGKTTLLKMINRLLEMTAGKIFIHGQDITEVPVTELRRNIGYVIQQVGLFPHMTIAENIATVPRELGWTEDKINQRIDFLLELTKLPLDFRNRFPRQLSGGQQQRVGLARALAANPMIMLMDEPFGAIDAITRTALQEEMIRIQRQLNTTILFVTHDVDEALKLGDKIVIMNEGVIQQYDTPLNIITRPANEFVSELVHSDDVIQHLGLITAEQAMASLSGQDVHVSETAVNVPQTENLKNVLQLLLKGANEIIVTSDDSNEPIGLITMDELKAHLVSDTGAESLSS